MDGSRGKSLKVERMTREEEGIDVFQRKPFIRVKCKVKSKALGIIRLNKVEKKCNQSGKWKLKKNDNEDRIAQYQHGYFWL